MTIDDVLKSYRPNVGVMLFHPDARVWIGRRVADFTDLTEFADRPNEWRWQMPQGGVDPGEDLREAALRELAEETGVTEAHATIIGEMGETIRYDLPEELIGKLWGGKYRGQEQGWFCLRFTGTDADIRLDAHDPAEFCEWKWVEPDRLPELIVPFKKRVYRAVVEAFRELA